MPSKGRYRYSHDILTSLLALGHTHTHGHGNGNSNDMDMKDERRLVPTLRHFLINTYSCPASLFPLFPSHSHNHHSSNHNNDNAALTLSISEELDEVLNKSMVINPFPSTTSTPSNIDDRTPPPVWCHSKGPSQVPLYHICYPSLI
jgi:hypothetical protein